MLSSVYVENELALRDFTVELEPFTIIVGPNGCGKTTLLRCLNPAVPKGRVVLHRSGEEVRLMSSAVKFFALGALQLRMDSHLVTPLNESGKGLGPAISRIRNERIDGPQQLVDLLRPIIPGAVNVGAETMTNGNLRAFVEFDSIGRVSSELLSEGTLFALALVVALLDPNPPSLLLVDDLDKGLHPAAFVELVSVMRAAQKANPELQIVATTHSPFLLGCFEAHEVRVMGRRPDGSATCKKLTDHPEYEHWKDSLDPGEFWASVGEEWVLSK